MMKMFSGRYAIVVSLWILTLMSALMLTPHAAVAQALETPEALVRRLTQEVQQGVRADKEIQVGNQARSMELIEAMILPSVNFERMTSIAAGRHWQQATPEQQQQLTNQFRSLLVSTYSGAIAQVKDQKFEIIALPGNPADNEVVVRSRAVQKRGAPILINYRLENTPSGWKIFDVNLMGVWLAQTYQNSFSSVITRAGIDGLIQRLAEKNKV